MRCRRDVMERHRRLEVLQVQRLAHSATAGLILSLSSALQFYFKLNTGMVLN